MYIGLSGRLYVYNNITPFYSSTANKIDIDTRTLIDSLHRKIQFNSLIVLNCDFDGVEWQFKIINRLSIKILTFNWKKIIQNFHYNIRSWETSRNILTFEIFCFGLCCESYTRRRRSVRCRLLFFLRFEFYDFIYIYIFIYICIAP